MTLHNIICPACGTDFELFVNENSERKVPCVKCGNELHVVYSLQITETPKSSEKCNDISCDKCSIMHSIIEGGNGNRCFYYEKSMLFLQMQEA